MPPLPADTRPRPRPPGFRIGIGSPGPATFALRTGYSVRRGRGAPARTPPQQADPEAPQRTPSIPRQRRANSSPDLRFPVDPEFSGRDSSPFFAFQALRSQAGSSQLNRVARAGGPAAGHSARVRLTSTVSTSARIAPWFVAHPYWVAREENSRMLASCELRVVAPTCNVKPTGRALSNVR